jgi:hypothetical protein
MLLLKAHVHAVSKVFAYLHYWIWLPQGWNVPAAALQQVSRACCRVNDLHTAMYVA